VLHMPAAALCLCALIREDNLQPHENKVKSKGMVTEVLHTSEK